MILVLLIIEVICLGVVFRDLILWKRYKSPEVSNYWKAHNKLVMFGAVLNLTAIVWIRYFKDIEVTPLTIVLMVTWPLSLVSSWFCFLKYWKEYERENTDSE